MIYIKRDYKSWILCNKEDVKFNFMSFSGTHLCPSCMGVCSSVSYDLEFAGTSGYVRYFSDGTLLKTFSTLKCDACNITFELPRGNVVRCSESDCLSDLFPYAYELRENNDAIIFSLYCYKFKYIQETNTFERIPFKFSLNFNLRSGITSLTAREDTTKSVYKDALILHYMKDTLTNEVIQLMESVLEESVFVVLCEIIAHKLSEIYRYKVDNLVSYSSFSSNISHDSTWSTFGSYTVYDTSGSSRFDIEIPSTITSTSASDYVSWSGGSSTTGLDGNLHTGFLRELMVFVKMPIKGFKAYQDILSWSFYTHNDVWRYNKSILRITCYGNNPIGSLLHAFKYPYSTSLAKVLYEKPSRILLLPTISCYFKDINNIIRLLTRDISLGSFEVQDFKSWCRGEFQYQSALLDLLLSKFGEGLLCNKLLSSKYFLADSIILYDKIIELESSAGTNFLDTSYIKGSMKKIHDYLSFTEGKFTKENVTLVYDINNLKKLNRDVVGYSFRLVKDIHQLMDLGRYLSLCVGGYDDKVLNGSSHIVCVKQGNKFVGCVELSPNFDVVVQAKGWDNELFEGELLDAVILWVRGCGLLVNTKDIDIQHKIKSNVM